MTSVRLFVRVRGQDAYRERTPKELKAAHERKRLAEARKFYRQFGLRVDGTAPGTDSGTAK
jgi:hypothetical protein